MDSFKNVNKKSKLCKFKVYNVLISDCKMITSVANTSIMSRNYHFSY